jgi:hypothetical protein
MEAEVGKLRSDFNKATGIVDGSMTKMERSSRKAAKGIESNMTQAAQKIGGAFKSFGTGLFAGLAAGGIAGIVNQFGAVASSVASIGDEAKRAGLSAKAFQELGYVAKANRIEVDALTDGMKELSLRADEYIATGKGSAAESFQRLGISAEELKKKLQDPSALFTEIIGKLSQLDKAAQIRISDELFGGTGGEKFVQLISQGEQGIKDTIAEAHRLGAVMDDEVIASAAELDKKFNAIATTVGTALKTAIVEAATELQKFIDQFRAFDERATSTLKDRFGELQTRYGQLVKQQGTTEDKLLSYIGKDAATEIEAVKAEMDKVAAELRQRATPELREKLVAQNTASTPYTPPPSTGGGRSKAATETERQAKATRNLIAELQQELSLVGATNTEREIANQLRRVGVDATSKEGQQIASLITQINAETEARDRAKEAAEKQHQAVENLFQMGTDAVGELIDGSAKASDVVKKLAAQLAIAAAQAALLGSGPLAGLFGTGGGCFGGTVTMTNFSGAIH